MHALPRLELLSRPGWDGQTPNILRAIAHHADLLGPFLRFSAALAMRGALPRRASELLALRAAWNCRSEFEWGHHVIYARAAGLSEAEIDDVAVGPAAPPWSDEDRALLSAADELHAHKAIADATWSALASRWSAAQLVEIPFVVGQYTMLSMVAGALGVPLEEGLPRLPRAAAAGGP
jgi:4-carboxymuconolactone decarboxylase